MRPLPRLAPRARGAVLAAAVAALAPACGRWSLTAIEPDRKAPAPACWDPGAPASTTWVGNSFAGPGESVQAHVSALFVDDGGRAYTNSMRPLFGGENAGIYEGGRVVARFGDMGTWGRFGGTAVAANARYAFLALTQTAVADSRQEDYPPAGTTWHVVRRHFTDGSPAPWPAGRGWNRTMAIISTTTPVRGLASSGTELYVVDGKTEGETGRIRVFDPETMVELRSFAAPRSSQIALDRGGRPWVIQETAAGGREIVAYSREGQRLPITISGVDSPTALAFDPKGRLLVGDDGPRQQVLTYDVSQAPVLVSRLGAEGGIYAEPRGELGAQRLAGIVGVGADALGNVHVASGLLGVELRTFRADGTPQVASYSTGIQQMADWDPELGGARLYTLLHRYELRCRGGAQPAWEPVAGTVDRFRYPEDRRLVDRDFWAAPLVRRIDGKLYLFAVSGVSASVDVFRLAGEIAVPIAAVSHGGGPWPGVQPAGRWIWTDRNGNGTPEPDEFEADGSTDEVRGAFVDRRGDIWIAGSTQIRRLPFGGDVTAGGPIYATATARTWPLPAPFLRVSRVEYLADEDALVVAGETSRAGSPRGSIGTDVGWFDGWTRSPRLRWQQPILSASSLADDVPRAISAPGGRLFVATQRAKILMFDADTGRFRGTLHPPAGSEATALHGGGVRAFRRPTGDYLVAVMDSVLARVVVHRVP